MNDSTHYKLRKIPRWRLVLFPILAPIVALLVRIYWRTARVSAVIGVEHVDRLAAENQAMIPCYWHQRQLFCASYLFRTRRKDFKMGALVSPSRDGEFGARIMECLGAQAIRGSGTRTGAQAMRELFMAMRQGGLSPVMTPDGSQGPIHEFKPGPIMLSQLSGAPMVPMSFAAKRSWRLGTWDRFLIPYPFTRIVIAIGKPQSVARGSKFGDTAELQDVMCAALNEVEELAERTLVRT